MVTGTRRFFAVAVALLISLAVWATPAVGASYPNDQYWPRQWGLKRIGTPAAWKVTRGKGITIAIIDTGIAGDQPDLRANMSRLAYDAIHGTNDAYDRCLPECHGTAVAGVAAAVTNNHYGVAGTAPDAKLMAVRISDTGGISGSAVTDGIMWAADHGAKVINISLGGYLTAIGNFGVPFVSDWDLAIIYATAKGALVVASAGNGVQNRVGYPGSPACASPAFDPAALCVGATDEYDKPAGFTNYGVRLDVMAPGVGIWTTSKLGFATPEQGTSLSSPMVAGVAALLMSMGATNVVAANILRATAKDLGSPGYDTTYGYGRVDAAAAVALCKQVCASVR